MKILIIYSSKYGCTKECANMICKEIGGSAHVVNIKENSKIDLNNYDVIAIGSPVYMGMINKNIIEFCRENLETLLGKKVFLFICGMSGKEKTFATMEQFFPQELLKVAISKYYLGGKMDVCKMTFFDKLITKMVANSKKDSKEELKSEILLDNIKAMANDINKK